MRKIFYLFLAVITHSAGRLSAQDILPGITVKNYNGKIIVSWKNQYPFEVKTINIQRSFDSSKNFKTIGSVLNPQNLENGFVDENPPYNKMYYRLFISMDAGNYFFSDPVRPVKETLPPLPMITQEVTVVPLVPNKKEEIPKEKVKPSKKETEKKQVVPEEKVVVPDEKIEVREEKIKVSRVAGSKNAKKGKQPVAKNDKKKKKNVESKIENQAAVITPDENTVAYPSKRIFAAKDNNVVINLQHFESRKYVVKFFDEDDKPLFELNRIKEDYLIVEKVNFLHSGWFYFEIYENGKMIERNKFYIPKDGKIIN